MREPSSQMMSKSNELQFYCLVEHSTKASLSKKKSCFCRTINKSVDSRVRLFIINFHLELSCPNRINIAEKKRIFLLFFYIFWILNYVASFRLCEGSSMEKKCEMKIERKSFSFSRIFFAACKSINWFPCFLPARISHSRGGVRLEVCRCFYHGAM